MIKTTKGIKEITRQGKAHCYFIPFISRERPRSRHGNLVTYERLLLTADGWLQEMVACEMRLVRRDGRLWVVGQLLSWLVAYEMVTGDGDLREFARIENGGMQLNQPPLGLGRWKDTGQA